MFAGLIELLPATMMKQSVRSYRMGALFRHMAKHAVYKLFSLKIVRRLFVLFSVGIFDGDQFTIIP